MQSMMLHDLDAANAYSAGGQTSCPRKDECQPQPAPGDHPGAGLKTAAGHLCDCSWQARLVSEVMQLCNLRIVTSRIPPVPIATRRLSTVSCRRRVELGLSLPPLLGC